MSGLTQDDISRLKQVYKQLKAKRIPFSVVLSTPNPVGITAAPRILDAVYVTKALYPVLSSGTVNSVTFNAPITSDALLLLAEDSLINWGTNAAVTVKLDGTTVDASMRTDEVVGNPNSAVKQTGLAAGTHTYEIDITPAESMNANALALYVIQSTSAVVFLQAKTGANDLRTFNLALNTGVNIGSGLSSFSSILYTCAQTPGFNNNTSTTNFTVSVQDTLANVLNKSSAITTLPTSISASSLIGGTSAIQFSLGFTSLVSANKYVVGAITNFLVA